MMDLWFSLYLVGHRGVVYVVWGEKLGYAITDQRVFAIYVFSVLGAGTTGRPSPVDLDLIQHGASGFFVSFDHFVGIF